ncbi:GNAT family N-acetyltransferase [uncultured Pluralibacter sp.]|uniref:GNAT family N-acetyltransferase n=1 Tax=uncultured Pluralibacter sp. TaxID=1490864 RepID=UPI00260D8C9F|nr:GNAT family N-acetyltransferase [uncultured Pluralibacter sp.]
MLIRKGINADLTRLECCDFSFTVSQIARGPFNDDDLHVEQVSEPWRKIYALDIQTLANHSDDPHALFRVAETAAGELAGFITASVSWNNFVSVDYIAVDAGQRRSGAAGKLMASVINWAKERDAPGLRLETQNINVPACRFYQRNGFRLGGYDRFLYHAMPEKGEVALFWYQMFS